ncbi:MAG: DUF1080 domain-containing protein [Planctomycetales bacterium]|nr:DUF1080 domain-containing protein [Planctomycetales bacterium]
MNRARRSTFVTSQHVALLLAFGCLACAGSARGETKQLFDGKTLGKWKVTDFAGHGKVQVEDGNLVIRDGVDLTGVTWSGEVLRENYEISLEAKRAEGSDFFCGLTFPVGKDHVSLIVGGWGGGIVGISSIDSADASENQTTTYHEFKNGQWYTIKARVTEKKIEAWIDKEQVVDVEREGHRLNVRFEVEPSQPLGIATWRTTAHLRKISVAPLYTAQKKAD